MRNAIILASLLIGTVALAAIAPDAQATGTRRLSVFGDTGTSSSTQANINEALAEGSTGFLGLGDYEYSASITQWKTMFAPLTDKGHWLALGNHDDLYGLGTALFPNGAQWSVNVNGARIVSLNTEARMDVGTSQYNTVRGELCNAAEPVRIMVMHKPWWLLSGAQHPGWEFPGSPSAMDQMVKDCKVSLVLAGHEHNFQRMVRNNVNYVISGTGGESIYPLAGVPSGTVASCACYGHLVLDVGAAGYSAFWETTGGSVKSSWSLTAPTTATTTTTTTTSTTSGATFSGSTGNEWWVQVNVAGSIASVASRDTDGAWVPLTHQSWGAWAGSYHVEPGHLVQYRATLVGGATVDSCPYTHPAGVAQCGASMTSSTGGTTTTTTTTFQATFLNMRGNAYWVETDVTSSGGTLVGVDASVNGGTWIPLAKTSWGSWAKSISAPAGSSVRFRADASDGQTVISAPKIW